MLIEQLYPGVGFISHLVDVRWWSRSAENRAITAAIHVARDQIAVPYQHDGLVDINPISNVHLPPYIRFDCRLVVISITNRFGDGDKNHPYIVSYVFYPKELFDETIPIQKVIENGFRDTNPVHFDPKATRPGNEYIFDILERYEKQKQEQQPTMAK